VLVKRKFSPASVLCDLSGVALPWRLFRFIAYHSLFYRRRYSPFNHSRFVKIPWEISWAFWEQRKPIDGCEPQLVDIVRMLQAITSSQPTFVCIDALDECVGVQRLRLLDSLKQILEKSPGTRIFMTGRSHILAEIEEHLAGRATSLSVSSTKNDIITHLRDRLDEDEKPDSMAENLEADILHKVPENISEMCVGKIILRTHPHYWLIGKFRFLLASLNIEAILEESTIYHISETGETQQNDKWARVGRCLL